MDTRIPAPDVDYISGKILVQKLGPSGEFPSKSEASDVGYDVTLTGRKDSRAEDTTGEINYFTTEISVKPPKGYHFELIAKPTLHRHGYMLATGCTVLNPSDTGELMVPLFKYSEVEDLELPFCAVQLVLRQSIYAHLSMSRNLKPSFGSGSSSTETDRYGTFHSGGVYVPDSASTLYSEGDKSAYRPGVRRAHASTPKRNHIF